MSIDIDSLSYEQLLELHHLISQRLKTLDSLRTPKDSSQFNQGDKVSFAHPTLGIQTGTLLAHNDKTVTIVASTGQKWDVSPHLLRKVVSKDKPSNKVYKIRDRSKK